MKKLAIAIGVLIIVVIVFLAIMFSKLGPIIKTAVNTYGPKVTKTEVVVGDVGISIFKGEAKLKDFRLGNPKGFKSPHAVSVGAIHVDVDEGSLAGDTIIIDKIEVSAPEIIYEKSLNTDNFQALLKNLQSSASAEKASQKQTGEGSPGKKILIRDFILKDGNVSLATTMFKGQSISAQIPDIHLKDLGKEGGGTSPAEVFEKVLAAVHKAVLSPGVSNVLKASMKDLGKDLEAAGEDAKKQLEAAGEDAQKQLETEVDSLRKGLFGN